MCIGGPIPRLLSIYIYIYMHRRSDPQALMCANLFENLFKDDSSSSFIIIFRIKFEIFYLKNYNYEESYKEKIPRNIINGEIENEEITIFYLLFKF